MSLRILLLLLGLTTGACNGPTGLMSGGKLDGELRPPPASWAFLGSSGQMQFETRPAQPYSVNVNYTIFDGKLYVNAGNTETKWAQNIAVNPLVRLRIDGLLYEVRAERVMDAAEIASFGKVWAEQSMFLRDPAQFQEVWLYRMAPR